MPGIVLLPDLHPTTLSNDATLIEAIEDMLKADPMQARWQRGIWKHHKSPTRGNV